MGHNMDMGRVEQASSLERMIQQQLVNRGISDQRVLEAMRTVPREQFMPEDVRRHALADGAAPIGHGQTISQPYIVARMTECLEVQAGHKVLEIGTGSGYQTAVLSRLSAEVYTVERVKPLLDAAFERLLEMGFRNVHFRYGDGMAGWADRSPFDRIMITAGAPSIPERLLLSQLSDGGLAVLPVGSEDEQMLIEVRRQGGSLVTTNVCACRFVRLIGEGAWQE